MKNKVCKISLFSCILAAVSAMPGYCAIKAKNENRSYATAYNQVNAIRQQAYIDANMPVATTASATATLPVAVDDEQLASSILNNDSSTDTTVADLDACAMIYPNGVFKWGIPESGVRRTPNNQCMAVVELIDANTNAVLATTTLGAGDSMKCNIDSFPESGYHLALSKIELPADEAPTMKDVESVMNEEQKQNAGLKIAAAAIISGVAGNILSPKTAGEETGKFGLGTGNTKLKTTALSAVAGAGVMAASTYSGKVAGDTIKSTAVNAASGAVIGNMMAGASNGDAFLTVVKCKIKNTEYDCVVGNTQTKSDEKVSPDSGKFLIINTAGEVKQCEEPSSGIKCESYTNSLVDIILEGNIEFKKLSSKNNEKRDKLTAYKQDTGSDNNSFKKTDGNSTDNNLYFKINSAYKSSDEKHAYAVFKDGAPAKLRRMKKSDWDNMQYENIEYYVRYSNGKTGDKIEDKNVIFEPSSYDASNGDLIDISNQARVKGTATGAAVGGALGGFSAYQGAQSEISERWTASMREYEGSLLNFVCVTGGRPLAKYNDYVEIPEMQKLEQ